MYADLQSKEEIRQKIAVKHRIAMLVGDNLEDFVESHAVHAQNEAALAPLCGKHWFVIPSPAHNPWPNALSADADQEVKACDRLATKKERDYCVSAKIGSKDE